MADVLDQADAVTDLFMQESLSRLKGSGLTPKKVCYNCERKVGPDQLYCDDQCEQDHSWFLERMKQKGE